MNDEHRVQEPDHLIITVHGIRTFGCWQERLEAMLKREGGEAGSRMEVFNYKYGYFSVLAFLIPPLRWLVTRRFRKALMTSVREKNWRRIDIVAHSFGTHLAAWGLYGVKSIDRPHIHTLLFSGTVLKPGFPWRELLGTSVGRVINDCGIRDLVLVLNQLLVLFTGMAGRVGFSGMTGQRFRNRFFDFGHSGYFRNAGQDDDSFMEQYWLPLLGGEGNVEMLADPRSSGPLSGFFTFIANNAEPVKLSIYMTVFLLAFAWIYGLYRTADEERMRAERQTRIAVARGLAAEARLAVEDSPTLAALLSAEALATTRRAAEGHVSEAEASFRTSLSHIGGFGIADFGGDVTALLIDESGSRIVASGFDQAGVCRPVHLWQSSGHVWEPPTVLPGTSDCSSASLSRDGRWLLTIGRRLRPVLWRVSPGLERVEKKELSFVSGEVRLAELSKDGHWLGLVAGPAGAIAEAPVNEADVPQTEASGDTQEHHVLYLFNLEEGGAVTTSLQVPWNSGVPVSLSFSQDGSRLAVVVLPNTPSVPTDNFQGMQTGNELYSAQSYDQLREVSHPVSPEGYKAKSPDFAVRQNRAEIHMWMLSGFAVPGGHTRFPTDCDQLSNLELGKSGNAVAATCDGSVYVWKADEEHGNWEAVLKGEDILKDGNVGGQVSTISPDEDWLVVTAPYARSFEFKKPGAMIWYFGSEDGVPRKFNVGIGSSQAIFSPDSMWLVLARPDRAVVWDLQKLLQGSGDAGGQTLSGAMEVAVFAPDSRELVTGSDNRSLHVWLLTGDTWRALLTLPGEERTTKLLQISDNGRTLVSADNQGNIRARAMAERQPVVDPAILWGASGPIYTDAAYRTYNVRDLDSQALDRLISESWTTSSDSRLGLKPGNDTAAISPGGGWLVTGSIPLTDGAIESANGVYLSNLRQNSPDRSRKLVCIGNIEMVWMLRTGVLFSPDDSLAVSLFERESCASRNGIRFIELTSGLGQGVWRKSAEGLEIEIMAFSPNGRWLAAGGKEADSTRRRVYLWNRERENWWEKPVDVTPKGEGHRYPWQINFSSDSSWLVVGAENGAHRLLDLNEDEVGRSYQSWPGSDARVVEAVFSPNSRWLVAVTAGEVDSGQVRESSSSTLDGATRQLTSRIWELKRPLVVDEGRSLHAVSGSVVSSMDIVFSSSGDWLITASPSRWGATLVDSGEVEVEAKLWRLGSGGIAEHVRHIEMPISTPVVRPGWVSRFSPNQRLLVIGREGGDSARLIGLIEDKTEISLALARGRNRPGLKAFEFSPDGTHLAILGDGISLWSLEPSLASPESVFLPHELLGRMDAEVSSESGYSYGVQLFGDQLAFTSDGSRLLAFGKKLAAVWTISIDDLNVKAESAVGRNMRWGEWGRYFGTAEYRRTFSGYPVDASVIQGLLDRVGSQAATGSGEGRKGYFGRLAAWSGELKDAALCNAVGWRGALLGFADEVGAAANCAVEYEPEVADYWDTRGLVRALTGDISGSLADFQTFLDLVEPDYPAETIAMREAWIRALKSGHNPIDPIVLEKLNGE